MAYEGIPSDFQPEDEFELKKQISYWDGYQTVSGRLNLLSNAFSGEKYLSIRANIAHEGSASQVAHNTFTVLKMREEGTVRQYVNTFRNELDNDSPADVVIKQNLDSILSKY